MTTTLTARQQDVLQGIRDGKRLIDIASDLDLSKQYVSLVLSQLTEAGLVLQPRRGRYVVTDQPGQYSKRPTVDEAVRLTTGDSATTIVDWAAKNGVEIKRVFAEGTPEVLGLIIHTPEGPERADLGDWIVLDVTGFNAMKPDVFADTYDAEITNA